jgi:hypothetical protein
MAQFDGFGIVGSERWPGVGGSGGGERHACAGREGAPTKGFHAHLPGYFP